MNSCLAGKAGSTRILTVFILFYYNSETSTRYGPLLINLIKFQKDFLIKNNFFFAPYNCREQTSKIRQQLYKTVSHN